MREKEPRSGTRKRLSLLERFRALRSDALRLSSFTPPSLFPKRSGAAVDTRGAGVDARTTSPSAATSSSQERQVQAVGDALINGQPGPTASTKKPRPPSLKVAIALMTRKPHRFDWWLRYHRSLGVCHVFVHVEDTPELLPLLTSAEFEGFVTVTTGSDNSIDTHRTKSKNNYYTLMQRQEVQVRQSVAAAKRKGIQWLFHIDDDELLYFKEPMARLVKELPSHLTCLTFVNIEAVPSSLHAECVFEEIEVFSQHLMLAYRNGKSAGRVSSATWHGPHRFTGPHHVVAVERACVLHFESCTYESWRNKFIKHKDMGEKKKSEIPFPFYRDSITLFQEDPDGGENEWRWKEFYRERKIRHFERLDESQKIRIRLTTSPKEMMDSSTHSICSWGCA